MLHHFLPFINVLRTLSLNSDASSCGPQGPLQPIPQTHQGVGHPTKEDKGLVGINREIRNSKVNAEEGETR